ncbi:MAG: tetratricopeptide repeat protein, partial [Planctomycetes bacterium]|nr:tetratricopeptide repeat protein [Planctomycetota bacterium]
MRRLAALVFILLGAPAAPGQDEPFDPARVNKWIVSLSEDPSQEAQVGELHAYLKKHGKLALVYSKFEESFERRPSDAKLRYLLGRLYLRDGNRAGALKCYTAAAQADPDYAYTYLAQAELFQEQGDEKNLVVALEGVIQSSKEKPAVAGAVRKLAGYYAKRQDLDRSASLWAALGERFPEDAAILNEALRGIVSAGKLPRAADFLRTILAFKGLAPSERARLFLELASLERRTGRTADASRSLAEASKAAQNDPALARKVDESILAYYRDEDRLKELAEEREKELTLNPASAVHVWRLARVRMAQGSFQMARELLARGLEMHPGHLLLLAALADVAAGQGKYVEVRELAIQLAAREPLLREHRKREGLACLELGKFDEADLCFKAYADTPAEMVDVAQLYEKRGRFTDAAAYYRRALDLKPEAAWSRALVGLLVRLDRLTEAEQEAVRCTAGDRERWALLRDLLVQRGEPAKACAYALKDVESNPKDFAALMGLGRLQAKHAPLDSEASFRKALDLAKKGERGAVYEELAGLVGALGLAKFTLLRNEIETRLKAEPGDGGYYYALFRMQPGQYRILEEGRSNDPRHVGLRQELASHFLQEKQFDVAIDLYRELIEVDPPRRDHYVHAIGEIYWALGHKDEAFSWWAKVQGTAKDKVGLTFQLAKKYESEKRYPQAIDLLQQIIREEPDGVLYHWALAQLYRQVSNAEGALQEFKWILAHAKDEGYLRTARQVLSEKLSERGRAYLEEGSFSRALEEFSEALRYAPDEPATGTLLAQMAKACEHLRDYAKAAQQYHLLLSRFPGMIVEASKGRTMNAQLFATLQLRGNPECLKAYEDAVGAQAKKLLDEAVQKNDRAGLERVLALYPMSRAAGDAVFALAEAHRKDGAAAKAAGWYERLLAEYSLAAGDEAVVRARIIELAAQLKDWGTVSTQVGELLARSKDKVVPLDGKTVNVKDFVKPWQKELATHGVGPGA